jgi:hypothetical protein
MKSSLFLILLAPLLLSSCMTMQSENQISTTGDTIYVVSVDMSQLVASMESKYGTGTASDSMSTPGGMATPKDLCIEFNGKRGKLEKYYTNVSCQSTGDYKAKISSTLPKDKNPGIIVSDEMIMIDPLWIEAVKSKATPTVLDAETATKLKTAGVVVTGEFQFPYPIIHQDAGTLVGTNSVQLDMLDSRVFTRKDLLIVARRDGQIPAKKDLLKYKKMLRTQIIKAKRSGKYKDIESIANM